MGVTININGLSLCHKGSGGISIATAPDVCKTKAEVPLPYPNIAVSADLANGTSTVTADGGHSVAISGSVFSKSTGDEPGEKGGVISGTLTQEASWLTFSGDVKFEGQNACRLTDKMLHNQGNTFNCSGEMQAPVSGMQQDVDCQAAWEYVLQIRDAILASGGDSDDPIVRNKYITAAYADLYARDNRLVWAALAAFVSKDAGCAMTAAKEKWLPATVAEVGVGILTDEVHAAIPEIVDNLAPDGLGFLVPDDWEQQAEAVIEGGAGAAEAVVDQQAGVPADHVGALYQGLADGNKAIFINVYPALLFFVLYGNDALQRCAPTLTPTISTFLLQALAKAAAGNRDESTHLILEQEQHHTVPESVYENEAYDFEAAIDYVQAAAAVEDRYNPEPFPLIPPLGTHLSSECGGAPFVRFEGEDFNQADQRLEHGMHVSETFLDPENKPSFEEELTKLEEPLADLDLPEEFGRDREKN